MKDEEQIGCVLAGWLVIFAAIACGLVGSFIGAVCEMNNQRDEAVRVGHAEYYLDKDNNRQWRWKQ